MEEQKTNKTRKKKNYKRQSGVRKRLICGKCLQMPTKVPKFYGLSNKTIDIMMYPKIAKKAKAKTGEKFAFMTRNFIKR